MPTSQKSSQPIALTIAGSDSGGGAGLQADLKTFAAIGAFGTSAVTCLTAQNPRRVSAVQAVPPAFLQEQVRAVFSELRPAACKTGMLYSESLIRALVEVWPKRKAPPLVVDPVMVATSGAQLLKPSAIRTLTRDLFPLATLITPNLDEAVLLLGHPIKSLAELQDAALELHLRHGCAVLLKGGHLRRSPSASDVFVDHGQQVVLSAPFVRGVSTHGTGCTYSAAITAYLALGLSLEEAVAMAKQHISAAIAQSVRVGRHSALNPFWS
jgi:hydroxymethylpyrimidine/phosphomethylpyrimidine kinase